MKKTYKWSQRLKVRNRGDRLCPGHMFVPFVMNISFSFFCSSRDCLDIVNQLIINVNVWPERWQEFLESCRLAVFTPWGQLIFHYKIHCFFLFCFISVLKWDLQNLGKRHSGKHVGLVMWRELRSCWRKETSM